MNWAQLSDYGDRYDVSDCGEVRIRDSGRILKKTLRYDGYYFVSLQWKGGRDVKMVHALVAEGHLGPRPDGELVRHLDGVRTNNHAANLAYGTQFDNMQDARRHGVIAIGSRNGHAKLTEAAVAAMRRLDGLIPQEVVANWLGVSKAIISQAMLGQTWRHVRPMESADEALKTLFHRANTRRAA